MIIARRWLMTISLQRIVFAFYLPTRHSSVSTTDGHFTFILVCRQIPYSFCTMAYAFARPGRISQSISSAAFKQSGIRADGRGKISPAGVIWLRSRRLGAGWLVACLLGWSGGRSRGSQRRRWMGAERRQESAER